MNWIFYSLITLFKLITMFVLLLLSALVVPLLAIIMLLGISLGYLRDLEPQHLPIKKYDISFPHLHANLFYLCSSGIMRVQHAWIQRHKSDH